MTGVMCWCRYCGSTTGLTIDHVVPLSKGGKWVWENLVTACTKCNSKKGSKSLKQLGWKLKNKPKARTPHDMHTCSLQRTLCRGFSQAALRHGACVSSGMRGWAMHIHSCCVQCRSPPHTNSECYWA